MKRSLLFTVALAAMTGLSAVAAQADDDDYRTMVQLPAGTQWMSASELAKKLEAQGYIIHEIETERGAYEVEMTDTKGLRVEGIFHPVTGEPLLPARKND